MKNVVVRSITGLVYIGLIVGAIVGGKVWMELLTLVFALLAVDEFNRISDSHRLPLVLRYIDCLGIALFPTSVFLLDGTLTIGFGIGLMLAYIIYLIVRLIVPLYIKVENPLNQTAHSLMGQLYIGVPMALLMATYLISPAVTMLMFIMIWLNDTGAFCVGSLLGKHRLFERISPKKSWEGFFGGVLFAVAAGVVAYYCFGDEYYYDFNLWKLALLGAVVAAFATWGDLVESLIKRTLGIKDSGHLLPGHGGILDRIDSLLLVAPATFIYLFIIQSL